jgi:sugar phosphate isomerase/epimerase
MFAIGVMLNNLDRDRLRAFEVAARLGFQMVHTNAVPESFLRGEQRAAYIAAAKRSGLTIDTMFVGFDGQSYVDVPSIRRTVGLTIPEFREHRLSVGRAYSELAAELGVTALALHLGFPRFERGSAGYQSFVDDLGGLLDDLALRGQSLRFETGQESAAELRGLIEDVSRPNAGVNYDPANFLLYDTDEPLAAFDALAPWVRGVHCKDATRPTVAETLGQDVQLGTGEVDFPALLARLRGTGYRGPLVIEREHGPNVVEEILAGREYLQSLFRVGGA